MIKIYALVILVEARQGPWNLGTIQVSVLPCHSGCCHLNPQNHELLYYHIDMDPDTMTPSEASYFGGTRNPLLLVL